MKKVFASLLMIAATVSAFAIDYTAKATLTLKNTNGDECQITIAQMDDATKAAQLCAEMNMDYRDIAFYVLDTKKYEIYASTNLGDLAFGLKVNNYKDYTLTATNVVGTIYLYDEVAKKTFTLKENAVYSFEATANAEDRFHLTATAPVLVPGICHQNGRLEITAYNGASVQVVNYDDNTVVAVPATTITDDYQEIDLANVAADKQYLVIVTKADQSVEKLVIKK